MSSNRYERQLARRLHRTGEALTDPEIIRACLDGEAIAWNALIERYEALIFSTARRFGLSAQDASDTFQEVCLVLLDHLQDLRDATRLAPWLVTATRHEISRAKRKRTPLLESEISSPEERGETYLNLIPDESAPPESALLALTDRHLVNGSLERISPDCRTLLTLLYIADPALSYQEVADRIGRPVGSVGPSRARCLQSLHKILQEVGF